MDGKTLREGLGGGMYRRGRTLAGATLALATVAAAVPAVEISLLRLNQGTGGFALQGLGAGDNTGYSVAPAGDVNGDGIADVVIGAPNSDPGGGATGGAFVVFGSASVLDPMQSSLSAIIMGSGGFAIRGVYDGDNAGRLVAGLGDVNGDGLGDVLVAAPRADAAGLEGAGTVYVVMGKTSTTPVALAAVANGSGGFAIHGEAVPGTVSGLQVSGLGSTASAVGDVNGDGLADVLAGYRSFDVPGVENAGRAYVVFGKTNTAAVEVVRISQGQGGGFTITGSGVDHFAASGLSGAGDVNGDGLMDIALASPTASTSGGSLAGRCYVVFGKSTIAPVALSSIEANLGGGFALYGQNTGDQIGRAVAGLGDVNGDGLGDVIFASSFADYGVSSSGASFVVFGRTLTANMNFSQVAAGFGGYRMKGTLSGQRHGERVASMGDANGDGLADICVHEAGLVTDFDYVFFGKTSSAVPLDGIDIDEYPETGLWTLAGAGDVNRDGAPDIVMGSSSEDTAGGVDAGRAYVAFNPLSMPVSSNYVGRFASGNPPRGGVGTQHQGKDATVNADSRCWIDFPTGTGPFAGGASQAVVTLTRTKSGVTGINPDAIANVRWTIQSDRVVAPGATARVFLRPAGFEASGQLTANVRIYTSTSLSGPWTPLANPLVDPVRREFSADATLDGTLRHFILGDTGNVQPAVPAVPLNGDANNDGFYTVADVTMIGNVSTGNNGGPAPGDADVDNNAVVNAADAAIVANHIVNGTPLP